MESYFINMDQTHNPGLHHEVHKTTCYWGQKVLVIKRIDLGYCNSETEAVAKGKKYYSDADGCKTCCLNAHTG
jgi:hypothetical protein